MPYNYVKPGIKLGVLKRRTTSGGSNKAVQKTVQKVVVPCLQECMNGSHYHCPHAHCPYINVSHETLMKHYKSHSISCSSEARTPNKIDSSVPELHSTSTDNMQCSAVHGIKTEPSDEAEALLSLLAESGDTTVKSNIGETEASFGGMEASNKVILDEADHRKLSRDQPVIPLKLSNISRVKNIQNELNNSVDQNLEVMNQRKKCEGVSYKRLRDSYGLPLPNKKRLKTTHIPLQDFDNNGRKLFSLLTNKSTNEPYFASSKEEFEKKLKAPLCYLCSDDLKYTKKGLLRHFHIFHLSNMVRLAGVMSAKCHLVCLNDNEGHFHCPHSKCSKIISSKEKMEKHISRQHRQEQIAKPSEQVDLEEHKTIVINSIDFVSTGEPGTLGEAPYIVKDYLPLTENDIVESVLEVCNIELAEELGDPPVTTDNSVCVTPKIEVAAQVVESLSNMSKPLKPKKKIKHPGTIEDDSLHLFMNLMKDVSGKPSVARHKNDFISRLKPPKCFLCYNYKHSQVTMCRLKKHFSQCHLNHSVKFPNATAILCKLNCEDEQANGHYHCPKAGCPVFLHKRDRLVAHYLKHFEEVKKVQNAKTVVDHKKKKKKPKFPPPPKVFDFQGVDFHKNTMLSVMESPQKLFDYLCLPYCYLCNPSPTFTYMSRLEKHFIAFHLKRSVDCGSCYSVLCQRGCSPRGPMVAHYHCPFCCKVVDGKIGYWVHLESHTREEQYLLIKGYPLTPHIAPEPPTWNLMYCGMPVQKVPSLTNDLEASAAAIQLPFCYLCDNGKNYIVQRRLDVHFRRCHVRPALPIDGIYAMACKKNCNPKLGLQAHYHCLLCPNTFVKKYLMKTHVHNKHLKAKKTEDPEYAEHYVPDQVEDHSVPDDWIPAHERVKVRQWESEFNEQVMSDRCCRGRKKFIITEKMKYLIDAHVRRDLKLSDHRLRNWVRFRGAKVISCPRLELYNILVIQCRRYDVDSENKALQAIEDPLKGGFELQLESNNPVGEFLQNFRIIPSFEQMFKIFYEIHVVSSHHPNALEMMKDIKKKYAYITRGLLDKFLLLCPLCGPSLKSSLTVPMITLENADRHNLAGFQIVLVDISDNPDGPFRYVVECRDRCSGFSWVFPAQSAEAEHIADIIVRGVLSYTGLPKLFITNCGNEFLDELVSHIDYKWFRPCADLAAQSREASNTLELLPTDAFISNLYQLVTEQPNSWANALPYFQYNLNHVNAGNSSQGPSAYHRLCRGKQFKGLMTEGAACSSTGGVGHSDLVNSSSEDSEDEEEDEDIYS